MEWVIIIAVVALIGLLVLRKSKTPQLPSVDEQPSAVAEERPGSIPETAVASLPEVLKPESKDQGDAPADEVSDKEEQTEASSTEEPSSDAISSSEIEFAAEEQAAAPPPAPVSDKDMEALRSGLKTTRKGFIGRIASLFRGKAKISPETIDELEEVLITADIGVKTATRLLDQARERVSKGDAAGGDAVYEGLRQDAAEILGKSTGGIEADKQPTLVLVVGVNGTGKTTTIGKLASRYASAGKNVVLGAGDTYRAAAVLQLEKWGARVGCEVIKGKEGADPSSVIFDTVKQGIEAKADIILCDTAGRLHTKAPLMEELAKLGRTAEKALGRPADHILLVLDATTGQNAIQQAALFREALPVTGLVLTKLDGTAKGGVILGIVDEHNLPVHYIGIGEKVEDLRTFDAQSFVAALFDRSEDEAEAS